MFPITAIALSVVNAMGYVKRSRISDDGKFMRRPTKPSPVLSTP